jgi:hypothetical protein
VFDYFSFDTIECLFFACNISYHIFKKLNLNSALLCDINDDQIFEIFLTFSYIYAISNLI